MRSNLLHAVTKNNSAIKHLNSVTTLTYNSKNPQKRRQHNPPTSKPIIYVNFCTCITAEDLCVFRSSHLCVISPISILSSRSIMFFHTSLFENLHLQLIRNILTYKNELFNFFSTPVFQKAPSEYFQYYVISNSFSY